MRYYKLVDVKRLADLPIDIIGCGTIGRPVALILAGMGAGRISLYDPDIVSPENLGNQGWRPEQLGQTKVEALAADCAKFGCMAKPNAQKVLANTPLFGDVRFYCVDSVEARRDIANIEGGSLHIDGRIGGERMQVVCRQVGKLLLPTIPAENGPAECGTQSTLYVGNVCAGIMVSQFARWLREEPPEDCFHSLGTACGKWRVVA
jgi:sulfur carrier protein ThiS adenylyltransferase